MGLPTTCQTANAKDISFMELCKFSMDFAKLENNRDPYYPYADPGANGPETWDKEVAANFDLDLIRYGDYALTWDNTVHTETTNRQFRQVGWKFEVAAHLGSRFKLYYRHHSQHLMDADGQGLRYPLYNAVGAQIVFYNRSDR